MRKRKSVISKNMIEVLDYHTSTTYIKNGKRRPKSTPTSEEVKKNNYKKAESELRMLIDNNFKAEDCYLTLTYEKAPPLEEAKRDIQRFIKRLAYHYEKAGEKLKYIYWPEGLSRIHFHVLFNRIEKISTNLFKKLWIYGKHKIVTYQGEAEDAKKLAAYHMKERWANGNKSKEEKIELFEKVFKRKWVPSKNLQKPRVKVETVKASEWSQYIPPRRGYYIEVDSVVEGVNLYGYPFRFYRLLKVKGGEMTRYESDRDKQKRRRTCYGAVERAGVET